MKHAKMMDLTIKRKMSKAGIWLVTILSLLAALITWTQSLQAEMKLIHGELPRKHLRVFEWHCYDCHGEGMKKGGFTFDKLSFRMNTIQSAETWQKVLNSINSGEMPPEDEEQLSHKDKADLLEDLSNQLAVARKALSDTGGAITMRRLNRREYENTIENLLGVQVDVQNLPDDMAGSGFDTQGASLYFSGDQFEQYLEIARAAIDRAFAKYSSPSLKVTGRSTNTKSGRKKRKSKSSQASGKSSHRMEVEAHVFSWIANDFKRRNPKLKKKTYTRKDTKELLQHAPDNYRWFNHVAWLKHPLSKHGSPLYNFFFGFSLPEVKLPAHGVGKRFVIRVRTGLLENDMPEYRQYLEYGTVPPGVKPGEMGLVGFQKVNAAVKNPEIIEFEYIPENQAGLRLLFRERHVNQLNAAKRFFVRDMDEKKRIGPSPALWVDWIEWEGPLEASQKSVDPILLPRKKGESTEAYHRRVIEAFAVRAFRTKKPMKPFIDQLMAMYKSELKARKSSTAALKEQLAVILASPGFLYLNEPTFGRESRRLSEHELSIRLSYFLWSGLPDETLKRLAVNGELKKPAILKQQAMRMLKDERIDALISGFTHQWLHMERLDFFQFNYEKHPRFDDSLKKSAREEVYATVKDLIQNDRPIGELLKSNHVVVNNLLAGYYGIHGVKGEHFRRVPVPRKMPRGGLLGMAAVMAMGSDGNKASPVERGVWIMRSLLNNPPPPAPANVPQLSRFEGKLISARAMQKIHQEQPQCAQCHRKIDPLGFGLHNFDAGGLWREVEVVEPVVQRLTNKQKRQDPNWREKIPRPKEFKINASGTMPNGPRFRDFYQLRDRVAERVDDFARGFTENLIAYGLGRPYSFTDRSLADQIIARAKRKNYAASEFLIALIESPAFQNK